MTAPLSALSPLPSITPLDAAPAAPNAAANTYTDTSGLEALKRDPDSPAALSAVAQQVEALFLQMMLKSMRDATAAANPDSNEMGMYQDMFDKQVALNMSQHLDLGIGRILKKQLADKAQPKGEELKIGAPAQPLTIGQNAVEFVQKLFPSVHRAATALGLNPVGLMAQAALETGWGQRMPRTAEGASSYNLFGIKAGEEWHGPKALAETLEVQNGVASPRKAAFRAYGTTEESINDFANLLRNSPRYKEALAAGGDVRAYIERMGKSGYATDPEYANKLNQILDSGAIQAVLNSRTAGL
jgi:peptidoglycan hydrolase FlgJ